MDKIIIQGGKALHGDVLISGAKNAALPVMAAALKSMSTRIGPGAITSRSMIVFMSVGMTLIIWGIC